MTLEEKIKKQMATESALTLKEVEKMWPELRGTMWYLRIKNELLYQEAKENFAKHLGLVIIESKLFKLFSKILRKLE